MRTKSNRISSQLCGVFQLVMLIIVFCFVNIVFAGPNPWKWGVTTVNYDPHTMSSQWIQIASESRQTWNNVTPSPFNILRNDTSANDVYLQYIDGDGGVLGGTTSYCGASICSQAGQTVTRATTRYDTVGTWHLDSNCMVPTNSFDARALATHEFGHFSSLGHSTSGCGGSDPATMCSSLPRGVPSCAYRSLTSDDRSSLNAQYP